MVSLHADTNNELHQEFASQGDDSQYLHISEVANLTPPSIETLKMAASIETQGGDTSQALSYLVSCALNHTL